MEIKEESIYPKLPSAPPIDDEGQTFRLHKIGDIQKLLVDERDKRKTLSKKYHRAVKIVNNVDMVLITATMGLGAAGVGLLSTVIAAPVVVVMEGAALVTGLLSLVGRYVNKKLSSKAEKHENIKVLAESKLNTISDHISKALTDNKVSDEEFTLIISELDKFRKMKDERKIKSKKNINDEIKNSLIEQGREEARVSFRKLFEKSSNVR